MLHCLFIKSTLTSALNKSPWFRLEFVYLKRMLSAVSRVDGIETAEVKPPCVTSYV